MDFLAMAQRCAANVHPQTMAAVARVESGFNEFAIGVVGGQLVRQPANKAEAVATAIALEQGGFNFSMGLGQVNRYNLVKYGLNYETAFEPCDNLKAGAAILTECFARAKKSFATDQASLQAAFSCYYSGNFSTGFRPDFQGQPSYVQKVLNSAGVGAATGTQPMAVARTGGTPANPSRKAVGRAGRFNATVEQGAMSESSAAVYGGGDVGVMVFQ